MSKPRTPAVPAAPLVEVPGTPLVTLGDTADALRLLQCDLALARTFVQNEVIEGDARSHEPEVWGGVLRLLDRIDEQLDAITEAAVATIVGAR